MVLMLPLSLVRNIYWTIKNHRPLFQGLEGEPIWKKAAALILCIKISRLNVKPYDMIAEKIKTENGQTKKTLKIFQRISEESAVEDIVSEDVFVLYSLPMLPFLFIGYILSISTGDLILRLLSVILK